MRIHKKLLEFSDFNPTKKTHQDNIFSMCQKIRDNKITLPLYQRDLSWTLQKAVDLFNYQLFGKAPIAPISMNQISKNSIVPQVSFISRNIVDENSIEADHLSVVDGQQRLSTNFKAFTNNVDFRNIVLDISKATFKLIKSAPTKSQIPVGILYNENEMVLMNYLKENNRNNYDLLYSPLLQVRTKLKNYNYTLNIAENLSEDEQIEWFEVLNNAGSRVSALQMAFSKLKVHGIDIYVDYTHPFKEKVSNYGFEDFFSPHTTNVSYPIAALNPAYEVLVMNREHKNNYAPIPSDTKESVLTQLDPVVLKEIFSLSLDSLEYALDFIAEHNLDKQITRIDYILYLSGYFCFHPNPIDEISDKLVNWIGETNFTNMSNSKRRSMFRELIMTTE